MHRSFGFAIASLGLFQHPENAKISIFPFRMSQLKCCISRSIWRIFKNYFWLKEENGGYCGWEFQVHRHFFYSSNVKNFQHPEDVKISIFPFTLLAEILYLQKYLTNFLKVFFGRQKRNLAIVVENFKGTDILVLQ